MNWNDFIPAYVQALTNAGIPKIDQAVDHKYSVEAFGIEPKKSKK